MHGFPDGHQLVSWRHINLMRKFFRSVRLVLGPGGIVKISTNQNATGVNLPDVIASAQDAGFEHVKEVQFDEWELADYKRAFGDYRDTTTYQKRCVLITSLFR